MVGQDVNVSISDKAKDQIFKLMQVDNKADWGLRVGVKSGGCSGLSYYMEFVEKPLANDKTFDLGDVKIFVDVFSAMYLNGSQLDYTDGLNGSGFVWNNPNASRTCGCGESFSA